MVPLKVRFRGTFPSGATPAADQQPAPMAPEAEVLPHRADTLQIAVNAKEKVVNYDSIFRSLNPPERSGPAPSAPLKSTMQQDAGPEKEQESRSPTGIQQKTVHPGAAARLDAAQRLMNRQDLAARGIVTAGLALILIAVVLELFLKRKGLALLVIGMAALLTGLILL